VGLLNPLFFHSHVSVPLMGFLTWLGYNKNVEISGMKVALLRILEQHLANVSNGLQMR
jgi:hypothetical protein